MVYSPAFGTPDATSHHTTRADSGAHDPVPSDDCGPLRNGALTLCR